MTLFRILTVTLCFSLLMLSLNSCQKGFSDENYQPDPHPNDTIVDYISRSRASVQGFVFDENNLPVAGVQVWADNNSTTTDQYGFYQFNNVLLPTSGSAIRVSRTGYYNASRAFSLTDNGFVEVKLMKRTVTGTISAASGGSVTTADGARVELPAQGVVIAATGVAYTGTVAVSAKWINPSADPGSMAAMPGDARGLNKDNKLRFTSSLGMLVVELHGDAGQLLQIASGKEATITIPITSSLQSRAPATVSLWSLDEMNGFWKEEMAATKTGNNYVGKVSHFSFWEAATGLPVVMLRARIVNGSSQPLVNTPVIVTPTGVPWMAGYGRFGYTDAAGYINAVVPASSNLMLDVATRCATSLYSIPVTTTTADVDLGDIQGNLGQGAVTLQGTVVNCANNPVTDGYIQFYDGGFNHRIPIYNGSFSFSGTACVNTTTSYVVVDRATFRQSEPQTITLSGQHNLGTLSACAVSSIATLTYEIDGFNYTASEPSLQPAGYLLAPTSSDWTQILIHGVSPDRDFSFQFNGGTAIGSAHYLTEVFCKGFAGERAISTVPISINITEYGNVGGFISGSFSGTMLDFVTNVPYTVSCSFRVRRNN